MDGIPRVGSVSEFLSEIAKRRVAWDPPIDDPLWFRGEALDYGAARLQPRVYRQKAKYGAELLDGESTLFEEFKRCAAQLAGLRTIPESDWDWYFLMQHHGAPTRLLDWTDGSLIALHFAIQGDPILNSFRTHFQPIEGVESGGSNNGDRQADPVVYVADPAWLDAKFPEPQIPRKYRKDIDYPSEMYLPREPNEDEPDLPKDPLVLDFPLFTRRVAAQRSRFIVFGQDADALASLLGHEDSRVKAISVEAAAIPSIRRELKMCGVTESVIFPDLDGLGRELSELWTMMFGGGDY